MPVTDENERVPLQTSVTARIAGSGSFLPDTTLNNFDLYEMESIRSVFDVERARSSLRGVEAVEDLVRRPGV